MTSIPTCIFIAGRSCLIIFRVSSSNILSNFLHDASPLSEDSDIAQAEYVVRRRPAVESVDIGPLRVDRLSSIFAPCHEGYIKPRRRRRASADPSAHRVGAGALTPKPLHSEMYKS
ncbi:hypothetical protein EVAR_28241_1 [Eumeta japonica]|uniref:Uncharacterized protein n=1 Tax=Eumeta variegata TaxID=151549 RepID=A0A4C1V745_EUMVA|nr:hypothetical protein EVAR_28241_1 [Eumeta japonica]